VANDARLASLGLAQQTRLLISLRALNLLCLA
jgi:hypothetical protein